MAVCTCSVRIFFEIEKLKFHGINSPLEFKKIKVVDDMEMETGGKAMSIPTKVKDIIVEQLGVDPEKVKAEASFIDDLGADSLDIVELVMAMEEEFDLEIPDEDAEKLRTVNDVASYLASKGK